MFLVLNPLRFFSTFCIVKPLFKPNLSVKVEGEWLLLSELLLKPLVNKINRLAKEHVRPPICVAQVPTHEIYIYKPAAGCMQIF